jgi:hypothetical protein
MWALPVGLAVLGTALLERPALALALGAAALAAGGAALAARRIGWCGVWLWALGGSILLGELSAVGFGGQRGRILWADAVLAVGLLVAALAGRRGWAVPRAPFLALLLPFLAWSALGLLQAPDPLTGVAELKEWVAAALAGLAAVTWARDAGRARVLLAAATATGVLLALAMLWTAWRHPSGLVLAVMMKVVDLPWGRSNYLAGILVLVFPVALGLLGQARGAAGRVAGAVALAVIGLGIAVSASKGAIVALLGALALACATAGRAASRAASALLVVLGLLAGLYLASPLRQVLDYRLQASALDFSASERLELYRLASDAFASRPVLGVGLNNFSVISNALRGRDTVPHNLELGLLAEVGLVGTVLGMAWVLTLGWAAWRARGRDARSRALGLGLWAAWLAFFLHNQLESTLYGQQFKLLLLLVAAATWRLGAGDD